jgi:hypothetical protein
MCNQYYDQVVYFVKQKIAYPRDWVTVYCKTCEILFLSITGFKTKFGNYSEIVELQTLLRMIASTNFTHIIRSS